MFITFNAVSDFFNSSNCPFFRLDKLSTCLEKEVINKSTYVCLYDNMSLSNIKLIADKLSLSVTSHSTHITLSSDNMTIYLIKSLPNINYVLTQENKQHLIPKILQEINSNNNVKQYSFYYENVNQYYDILNYKIDTQYVSHNGVLYEIPDDIKSTIHSIYIHKNDKGKIANIYILNHESVIHSNIDPQGYLCTTLKGADINDHNINILISNLSILNVDEGSDVYRNKILNSII